MRRGDGNSCILLLSPLQLIGGMGVELMTTDLFLWILVKLEREGAGGGRFQLMKESDKFYCHCSINLNHKLVNSCVAGMRHMIGLIRDFLLVNEMTVQNQRFAIRNCGTVHELITPSQKKELNCNERD